MTPHGCYLASFALLVLAALTAASDKPKLARWSFVLLAAGLAVYVLPAAFELHA